MIQQNGFDCDIIELPGIPEFYIDGLAKYQIVNGLLRWVAFSRQGETNVAVYRCVAPLETIVKGEAYRRMLIEQSSATALSTLRAN